MAITMTCPVTHRVGAGKQRTDGSSVHWCTGGANRVTISKAVMQGTRCANVVPWWVSCPLASDGVDGEEK